MIVIFIIGIDDNPVLVTKLFLQFPVNPVREIGGG